MSYLKFSSKRKATVGIWKRIPVVSRRQRAYLVSGEVNNIYPVPAMTSRRSSCSLLLIITGMSFRVRCLRIEVYCGMLLFPKVNSAYWGTRCDAGMAGVSCHHSHDQDNSGWPAFVTVFNSIINICQLHHFPPKRSLDRQQDCIVAQDGCLLAGCAV